MTDWLTPEERRPIAREAHIAANTPALEGNAYVGRNEWGAQYRDDVPRLLAHAAEADRRLAERDAMIRELAGALRELTDHLELGTSPLPETVRLNRASLARVDAMGGDDE